MQSSPNISLYRPRVPPSNNNNKNWKMAVKYISYVMKPMMKMPLGAPPNKTGFFLLLFLYMRLRQVFNRPRKLDIESIISNPLSALDRQSSGTFPATQRFGHYESRKLSFQRQLSNVFPHVMFFFFQLLGSFVSFRFWFWLFGWPLPVCST